MHFRLDSLDPVLDSEICGIVNWLRALWERQFDYLPIQFDPRVGKRRDNRVHHHVTLDVRDIVVLAERGSGLKGIRVTLLRLTVDTFIEQPSKVAFLLSQHRGSSPFSIDVVGVSLLGESASVREVIQQ